MPKKRKKYNARKGGEIAARLELKDRAVIFLKGMEGFYIVCLKTMDIFTVGSDYIVRCLHNYRYKWAVNMAAMGQVGADQYIKSAVLKTQEYYLQSEIGDVATEEHMKVIDSIPKDQLVGIGWIASPEGKEISEEDMFNLFEKLGAWKEKYVRAD